MDFNGNQIVEVQINAVSKGFEELQRALHDHSWGIGSYLAKQLVI